MRYTGLKHADALHPFPYRSRRDWPLYPDRPDELTAAPILSTFFSITNNTFDGLKNTKREMRKRMKTYGAGRVKIFLKLKVSTALPNFITALKITLPWAVIGAPIAEWLGASQGPGYFSRRMMTKLDGSAVFAAVLLLSILALIGLSLVKMARPQVDRLAQRSLMPNRQKPVAFREESDV